MGFVIFNASAGSGKTFTLTVRYLTIILDSKLSPLVFKKILAVTFTNKAVSELKERIVNNLKLFAKDPKATQSPLFIEVKKELDIDEKSLQDRANLVLKKLLHNYGFFQINTIDRFNYRLIQSMSDGGNQRRHFQISLEEKQYLLRATSELLESVNADHPLSSVLIKYAKEKINESGSWDFTKNISQVVQILLDETHYNHFKTLSKFELQTFIQLEKILEKNELESLEVLKLQATFFFEALKKNKLEKEDFSGGYCYNFFANVRDENFSKLKFDLAWIKNIDTKPLYKKALEKKSPQKARIIDKLKVDISEQIKLIEKEVLRIRFLKNLIKNITPTGIINSILQVLEKIKNQESIMFVSEFNKLISESIRDYSTPFIYQRLGMRYRYYFIDEFQDTSYLQWKNLTPLLSNALESLDEEGKDGKLYLVGDPKQSIYRWRGGLPEQFIDLYSKKDEPFQVKAQSLSLEYNYRSCEEIVKFNNHFFSFISNYLHKPEHQTIYHEKLSSQKTTKKDSGYVEISFIEKESSEDGSLKYCEKCLDIIRTLTSKSYKGSDICIIVRTNSDVATLSSYLQNSEPPIMVDTQEGLTLNDNLQIQFLNNLVNWSYQFEENYLYWDIAYFLLSKKTPAKHKEIAHFINNFQDRLKEDYNFDLSIYKSLSLYEAAIYSINCFSLYWDNYIQSYLDVIFKFSHNKNRGNTAFDFVDFWEQSKNLNASNTPNDSSIKIMTIHKSKGLEFPVVIFPFAETEIYKERNGFLWTPIDNQFRSPIPYALFSKSETAKYNPNLYSSEVKDLYKESIEKLELDNFNLLYVCLTRAKERLYILTQAMPKNKSINESAVNFPSIFRAFLEDQALWNDDKYCYAFGDQGDVLRENNDNVECSSEQLLIEKPFSLVEKPIYSKEKQPYHKSKKRGILIHKVLSMLDKKSDISLILDELFADKNQAFSKDLMEKILKNVISHPKLAPLFVGNYQILNEQRIFTDDGRIIRPDKLFIDGQKVTILDFKTGAAKEQHKEQIEYYDLVIRKMGYQIKEKLLVYIDDDKISISPIT